MAAKLVNMKLDPKEREKNYAESTLAERPQYPYGLCLHLDEEAMAKLGLSTLPRVGKPVMIMAIADVTSVSENEYQNGEGKAEKRQCVGLQITDMAMSDAPDEKPAEQALYKS